MPYVKQERRPILDKIVDELYRADVKADGDLNYILYAYCSRFLKPSYNIYKNYIGELNETVSEIRRRILAPYEDTKKEENGDV